MNFRNMTPRLREALTAHQADATAQADAWTRQRLRVYLEAVERQVLANHSFIRPARNYDRRFAR